MSSMIAATRNRRTAGKPPENFKTSKTQKENPKTIVKKKIEPVPIEEVQEIEDEEQTSAPVDAEIKELPFMEIPELPRVVRRFGNKAETDQMKEGVVKPEPGFSNRAPLQADERARELIKSTLQHPISLTAEDLLNVSEPMRQELKKLLTKKRIEKKVGESGVWQNPNSNRGAMINQLPDATCEILSKDREGMLKGAIIIGDPVSQYLATLRPGEKPKPIVVAQESQGLRAIYPMINGIGEAESLLDSGSQIISMDRGVAKQLEINWDPDITIEMESANKSLARTLGLARNVPFLCGYITVYLQIHIMMDPAYKVLLGRPFDIVTESLVKNESDGSQTITLTDPNTGERCVMDTHERGKVPDILRKAVKQDFQPILRK